jgi:transposase-like protein
MTEKQWTEKEKLDIVIACMESERRFEEIQKQYSLSDAVLESWLHEVHSRPEYRRMLPKLPNVRPEFEAHKTACVQDLKELLSLISVLTPTDSLFDFLRKHYEKFYVFSLSELGLEKIVPVGYSPTEARPDLSQCEPEQEAEEAFAQMSSYAEAQRIKEPEWETRCERVSARTSVVYANKKGNCPAIPVAVRRAQTLLEELEWLPAATASTYPDPNVPQHFRTPRFEQWQCCDDGTVTVLEYLVRRSRESASVLWNHAKTESDNLRRGQIHRLLQRLERFAQLYGAFI